MGAKIPATELEFIRFWPLPFGEILWDLSTQVSEIILSSYITVFDPRRGKIRRFIPFLFYTLLYPNIASYLANLDILSP